MIQKRISLIAKIREQYPNIKNITEAVRKYNEDNNENVPLFVSTNTHGNKPPIFNFPGLKIKGRCPECKDILTVRVECGGMGTTRISCTKCTYTRITEKPISEWLEE